MTPAFLKVLDRNLFKVNIRENFMPAVVLVGHDHDCPLCGPTTVDSGAENFNINNRSVARVGDTLGCGAVINSGSDLMSIEGQAVARVGDTTDHDGTLENGDACWLVD